LEIEVTMLVTGRGPSILGVEVDDAASEKTRCRRS